MALTLVLMHNWQKEIMGIPNIFATLFAATVILAGLTLASVVGVFVSLGLSEWLPNEDRRG
jgi:hypothetical protein